jgi:hypothetical protein
MDAISLGLTPEKRTPKVSFMTAYVQESSLCPPLQGPSTAKQRLQGLKTVDWSKKNKDWEGVCIVANSVASIGRPDLLPRPT